MNPLVKVFLVFMYAVSPVFCTAAFIPENQRRIPTVTIHVSPLGDDAGDGSARGPSRPWLVPSARPVRPTPARMSSWSSPMACIASTSRCNSGPPMVARPERASCGRRRAGASPVIAGSVPVTGWKLHDRERQIYVADIPVGHGQPADLGERSSRETGVDRDRTARRSTFDADGMTINDPQLRLSGRHCRRSIGSKCNRPAGSPIVCRR